MDMIKELEGLLEFLQHMVRMEGLDASRVEFLKRKIQALTEAIKELREKKKKEELDNGNSLSKSKRR